MADAKKTNANALIVTDAPPTPAPRSMAAEDIRPLKAPVEIPSNAWMLWGAMALAFVVGAFWLWWSATKKRRIAPTAPPPPPPAVRARQRLKEALGLINEPKLFCSEVADALRVYLEERFHLHAPERTTEEFLSELQSSATLSPPQKVSLQDFLTKCDLAKFARYKPSMMELMAMQRAAIEFVDQTDAPAAATPPTTPSTPPPPAKSPALAQR